MLTLEQGKKLIKVARKTLEIFFEKEKFELIEIEDKIFKEKRGIFVTLEKFPDKSLRGCIGFPYPVLPLGEAVQKATFSAAFEDSRFPPLKKEELDKILIEVSVLTEPELIKVKNSKDYFKEIKIGKHGLILLNGSSGGLFLPQVPVEQKWNVEQYLENLCYKAGLTSDIWMNTLTRIYRFETEIFSE